MFKADLNRFKRENWRFTPSYLTDLFPRLTPSHTTLGSIK